jgi:Zn-finger nucleic acid-binding protein
MDSAMAASFEERDFRIEPCPRCGKVVTDAGALEPFGISWDRAGNPVLIMYHCACRTSRSLQWEDAPKDLRRKAVRWFVQKGAETDG